MIIFRSTLDHGLIQFSSQSNSKANQTNQKMSASLQNWVSSKTAKAFETTLSELKGVAVKYNNFSGAHHEFIQVTSLGGEKVRICKTKTPEMRTSRHTVEPKAIWTLLNAARQTKAAVTPVAAPTPSYTSVEVEVEQVMQYLVNAVDSMVVAQAAQAAPVFEELELDEVVVVVHHIPGQIVDMMGCDDVVEDNEVEILEVFGPEQKPREIVDLMGED